MENQIIIPLTCGQQVLQLAFASFETEPELSGITLEPSGDKNPKIMLRADFFADPYQAFTQWVGYIQDPAPATLTFAVGDTASLEINLEHGFVQVLHKGIEFVYWDFAEFAEAPAEVVSALCGALASVAFVHATSTSDVHGIYTSHWEEGNIDTAGTLSLTPPFSVKAAVSISGDDYEHHIKDTFTCRIAGVEYVLDVEDDALTADSIVRIRRD